MTALLERQLKTKNVGKRLSLPYIVIQCIVVQIRDGNSWLDAAMMHCMQQDCVFLRQALTAFFINTGGGARAC